MCVCVQTQGIYTHTNTRLVQCYNLCLYIYLWIPDISFSAPKAKDACFLATTATPITFSLARFALILIDPPKSIASLPNQNQLLCYFYLDLFIKLIWLFSPSRPYISGLLWSAFQISKPTKLPLCSTNDVAFNASFHFLLTYICLLPGWSHKLDTFPNHIWLPPSLSLIKDLLLPWGSHGIILKTKPNKQKQSLNFPGVHTASYLSLFICQIINSMVIVN